MANQFAEQKISTEAGAVSFPCPKCLKETIVRSKHDREVVVKYTCASCGFEGPN